MYKVNSITYNALQNEDILLAKRNSKQNEYKYGCCADRHKKKQKQEQKQQTVASEEINVLEQYCSSFQGTHMITSLHFM